MTTPTFQDIEQLSAFLDGQLSRVDTVRLESRLASDRDLVAALADLRLSRNILRRTPQRRAPRNFTLTAKMAGIRPPLPRFVPALNWASAVATLFFVFTLGSNLLGRMSFGAAAPMMAAAPAGMESGVGYGGGPADTTSQEPMIAENAVGPTAAPADDTLKVPQATPLPETRLMPSDTTLTRQTGTANPWPSIWLGLTILLIVLAFLIRWGNQQAFKRRNSKK